MAQPPSRRRLLVEDFPPDQQEWIGDLLQILNEFMDQTIFAMTQNLSLKQNSLAIVKDLNFKGNATIAGDTTSALNTISNVSSTVSLVIGMKIQGEGLPSGTVITNIVGNVITVSNPSTSTLVGVTFIVGNNFPINFRYTLGTRPLSLRIGQIFEDVTNAQIIANPVSVDWEIVGTQIVINHITGLKANMPYQATFILEGE